MTEDDSPAVQTFLEDLSLHANLKSLQSTDYSDNFVSYRVLLDSLLKSLSIAHFGSLESLEVEYVRFVHDAVRDDAIKKFIEEIKALRPPNLKKVWLRGCEDIL